MKSLRLLIITFFIAQISFAQTWQDTVSLIEKAYSNYKPENPGCQLSISRNGEIIFSKAWGMADLERNVPLTINSILEGGSVSKQFTAAAILLLEQQGKLSLDDNVKKYIPELPDYGATITLRQMMHHTSGLRDWGSVAGLTGWERGTKFYTNNDALEIIARQKHLNNKPGDEYLYSNSNYNLFAIIVQRVSGLSLAAFTKQFIFQPAGMEHTQWRDDPNRIVPNRAIAYLKADSIYKTEMPNEYVYGNGGLLTTTEDLLKWTDFYQSGKLGSPSLYAKQVQTESLNNGVKNSYAAGLVISNVLGWNNISHSGATASYRAYVETFPDLHLSIAVLSNTSEFNIRSSEEKVRRIFVHDKTVKQANKDSSYIVPAATLSSFAGMYLNERDGSTFQLAVNNNQLILDDYLPLRPAPDNILKADNFYFSFNGSKGMYITSDPVDSIPFVKVIPVHLTSKNLNVYTGKYFSEETNSTIEIQPDSSRLLIHLNSDKAYALMPTYIDAFKVNELDGDIKFLRDKQNNIYLMTISVSRARNVEFKKLKQ